MKQTKKFQPAINIKDKIQHHKLLINKNLKAMGFSLSKRKRIEKIYDSYINEENINNYYHRPIKLFIKALLTGNLNQISKYVNLP